MSRRDRLIADAVDRKRRFDAIDKAAGIATPEDVGAREVISTARSAIDCALRRGDLALAADAFVLLGEFLERGN